MNSVVRTCVLYCEVMCGLDMKIMEFMSSLFSFCTGYYYLSCKFQMNQTIPIWMHLNVVKAAPWWQRGGGTLRTKWSAHGCHLFFGDRLVLQGTWATFTMCRSGISYHLCGKYLVHSSRTSLINRNEFKSQLPIIICNTHNKYQDFSS